VRLDSGDLAALSRTARTLLDTAGLPQAKVFASGGLDEHEVAALIGGGAPIDAFGIGTQMGVSADAPFVDSVYKLTEFDGRPTLKLSSGKASLPGRKQVWRTIGDGELRDTLGLRDEAGPPETRPLLEPVMRDGRPFAPPPTIPDALRTFQGELAQVPEPARRLEHPEQVEVARSAALLELTEETRAAALAKAEIG
jgi:nicotinate phosphoribosyltransferase